MKPGPACSICLDIRRANIERGCDEQSIAWAASKFKLSLPTLKKHRSRCKQLTKAERKKGDDPAPSPAPDPPPIPPPEFPHLSETATELERVNAQCDWLEARIAHEQKTENDSKNLAQLSNALTSARKHQSALSGSKTITMHQLLECPHWLTVKLAIVRALAENKDALNAVIKAIQELSGEDAQGT